MSLSLLFFIPNFFVYKVENLFKGLVLGFVSGQLIKYQRLVNHSNTLKSITVSLTRPVSGYVSK